MKARIEDRLILEIVPDDEAEGRYLTELQKAGKLDNISVRIVPPVTVLEKGKAPVKEHPAPITLEPTAPEPAQEEQDDLFATPGQDTAAPAEAPTAPAEAPAKPPVEVDMKALRIQVKAQLDELKVKYNDKAGTNTLVKLLEKARTEEPPATTNKKKLASPPAAAPATAPAKTAAKAPATKGKTVTVEDIRNGLKRYAAKFGAAKAKDLLIKFKATKVSEIRGATILPFLKAMADEEAKNE